jgi:citrate lyase subunit beta / citryl-CoA lyase
MPSDLVVHVRTLVPKSESAEQLRRVAAETGLPVLALAETARGLLALSELTTVAIRLLLGTIDLALNLGSNNDVVLDIACSDLVRHSTAAGLPAPVDGASTTVRDLDAVTAAARHGRPFGLGGEHMHPPRSAHRSC